MQKILAVFFLSFLILTACGKKEVSPPAAVQEKLPPLIDLKGKIYPPGPGVYNPTSEPSL